LGEIDILKKSIDGALLGAKDRVLTRAGDSINALLESCFGSFRERFASDPDRLILHQLSDTDSMQVTQIVTSRANASAATALEALRNLEKANRQLHETKRRLRDTPEDAVLQPTFEALAEASQKLGAVNHRMAQLDEKRTTLENQRAALQRQKDRLLERIGATTAAGEKLSVVKDKILPALDKYRERLTKLKIASLESAVTECFNRLARKTDFIRSITIDPKTFAVHVLDKHGESIPKEELSSGEKQMFAIGMLWGLAKTSGRALPMVIDTPLARLDSDHRMNLIERYFPHASQQVILLSTDTEVDQPLFEALSPHISHCYHLRYDATAEATVAEERYFWRTKKVA
jgi:DNA sulfur modification protein DndD